MVSPGKSVFMEVFSISFSSLLFWSFFPMQRASFNFLQDWFSVPSVVKETLYLSFYLFWMIALLNRVFLAAYFSRSACWIYHVILFWPAKFLGRDLLLTLFVFPCELGISFLFLLLGFFSLSIYFAPDTHCRTQDSSKLKVRKWRTSYHDNTCQKKTRLATVI